MTDATPAPEPAAAPAPVGVVNPGKTMGIVGLVMAFFFGLNIIGLVLSIIGLNKSKKVGLKNGPALAGIIVSIVTIIIGAIVLISVIALTTAGVTAFQELCEGYTSGVYELGDGTQITCP